MIQIQTNRNLEKPSQTVRNLVNLQENSGQKKLQLTSAQVAF